MSSQPRNARRKGSGKTPIPTLISGFIGKVRKLRSSNIESGNSSSSPCDINKQSEFFSNSCFFFSEMTSVNRQVAPNRAREDRDFSQHSKAKIRGCELAWSRDLIYANVQICLSLKAGPKAMKGMGQSPTPKKKKEDTSEPACLSIKR